MDSQVFIWIVKCSHMDSLTHLLLWVSCLSGVNSFVDKYRSSPPTTTPRLPFEPSSMSVPPVAAFPLTPILSRDGTVLLNELPPVIVSPESTTSVFHLFLVDSSSYALGTLNAVLDEFRALESEALSSGPPGSVQVACICFGVDHVYTSFVPAGTPLLPAGGADFVRLASVSPFGRDSLDVCAADGLGAQVVNGVLDRIKKPLDRGRIVLCTSHAKTVPMAELSLFMAIKRTLKRPVFPCGFYTINVGMGYRFDVVEDAMHSVLHTVNHAISADCTALAPGQSALGPGFVLLRDMMDDAGASPAAISSFSVHVALLHYWRICSLFRYCTRLLSNVCAAAISHEHVTAAVAGLTSALSEAKRVRDMLRIALDSVASEQDPTRPSCFGVDGRLVPVEQGGSPSLTSVERPMRSFLACVSLVTLYIDVFYQLRKSIETLNEKRRLFVRLVREHAGLIASEPVSSMVTATRYYSLSPASLRKSLYSLVMGVSSEGDIAVNSVYEDVNMETYAGAVAALRANDTRMIAISTVYNAYTMSKLLPVPVRSLLLHKRPAEVAMRPWLVSVDTLPTMMKFISVGDFYGRERRLLCVHNETMNSFIPLPCSDGASAVIHVLATAAVTGDPELYHPEALGALAAAVVYRAAVGDGARPFQATGFWVEEIDRALDVYRRGYPPGACVDLQRYMSDVCIDGTFRFCLVTSSPQLSSHYTCSSFIKYALGVALGGDRLSLDQFRMRYKALVLELIGRSRLPAVPVKVAPKASAVAKYSDALLAGYKAGEAVAKWVCMEDGVAEFRATVRDFCRLSLCAEDVLEPPVLVMDDGGLAASIRLWGRVMGNLYMYSRRSTVPTPSPADVYEAMRLTDGELSRLLSVGISAVSSYHRSVMPGWAGSDDVGYGHGAAVEAFTEWKIKFETECVCEFVRLYAEESRRIHSEVAYHVPAEYSLSLLLLTGEDVDAQLSLTPSGLSRTRCMCPSCPFFLKDLDPSRVTRKRLGMSAALASHLRYAPVIPALHRTVALVPPSMASPTGNLEATLVPAEHPMLDLAVWRVYDGACLRVHPPVTDCGVSRLRAIVDTAVRDAVKGQAVLEEPYPTCVNYIPYLCTAVRGVRELERRWPFERFVADVRAARVCSGVDEVAPRACEGSWMDVFAHM